MNNTTPAVLAAMEIVEALAAAPEGLSQAALASSIGLSTSTAYRILRSLAARGWVYKSTRGVYRLGSGLLAVACAVETEHEALLRSRETLERLASENGIACKLSIRRGMQQVIYARAEPESPFHTTGQEGRAFPLVEGDEPEPLQRGHGVLVMDEQAQEVDVLVRVVLLGLDGEGNRLRHASAVTGRSKGKDVHAHIVGQEEAKANLFRPYAIGFRMFPA